MHGKTAAAKQRVNASAQVMDMLVEQTHDVRHEWRSNERPMRFTDTRLDEQQRGVSLKMVPISLVMEGSSGKSYVMNLVDTPGAPLPATSCCGDSREQLLFCSCLSVHRSCRYTTHALRLLDLAGACMLNRMEGGKSTSAPGEDGFASRSHILWTGPCAGHVTCNNEAKAGLWTSDGVLLCAAKASR